MDKIDIKSLSKSGLEGKLKELGEAPYRARQIFKWLYKVGVASFDDMTNIPLIFRKILKNKFYIMRLVVRSSKRSSLDGTAKYLFKLRDGNTIESVFLPEIERNTICLSSQVGCKYACSFCASAPFGFVRNLKTSEILDQAIVLKKENPSYGIANLVFMGIGEPLDNYDNVIKAIKIFNDKDAFNIGARKITISTCGIIPGIKKLEKEHLQIELSVSLHSAHDDVRSKLIPINRRHHLRDLIDACREYIENTNRIITFEYILIKDVNSSEEDALALACLLGGIKCKVNTISYNEIPAKDYKAPSGRDVRMFVKALKREGINAVHRKSKGEDIDAGCGQLRIALL